MGCSCSFCKFCFPSVRESWPIEVRQRVFCKVLWLKALFKDFCLWCDYYFFCFFFSCELVGMCVPYCLSGFCSARVSSVLEGGYRLLAVGGEGDD